MFQDGCYEAKRRVRLFLYESACYSQLKRYNANNPIENHYELYFKDASLL